MSRKLLAGGIGAVSVVAILFLQSVEHWSVIDSVLSALKHEGSAGSWLAAVLTSPLLPLVLAIAAIVLVVEGRKEKHEVGSEISPGKSSQSEARARISDSGNSAAAARIGDINIY